MDKRFEYRGDLEVTPLAEILATIHRYRVPGVVSVTRDGRSRKIFLDEGVVVFVISNEKETSLGMYLLRQGILKPDAAREADERRERDGLPLGQVLLQMGILTPERLNEAILGQTREILWGAFDWEAGEVLFEIGNRETGVLIRMNLPIPEVILEGIRRATDVKRLVQRLGSGQTVLQKTPSPLIKLFSLEEQRFYGSVDGKIPLQELCSKGPRTTSENARVLYAFYCLGLVRKLRAAARRGKKIQYKTEGGGLGG